MPWHIYLKKKISKIASDLNNSIKSHPSLMFGANECSLFLTGIGSK